MALDGAVASGTAVTLDAVGRVVGSTVKALFGVEFTVRVASNDVDAALLISTELTQGATEV